MDFLDALDELVGLLASQIYVSLEISEHLASANPDMGKVADLRADMEDRHAQITILREKLREPVTAARQIFDLAERSELSGR